MKYLIVNADDFGYSKVFNKKILELIEESCVSSTSVMVDHLSSEQDDQIKKLIELRGDHCLSIGLHIEFCDDNFNKTIERQYEKFCTIFGYQPDHIDLHKSTYLYQSYALIKEFCKEKHISCRHYDIGSARVITTTSEVIDGTSKNVHELKSIIENCKEGESYEIFFHPGEYDPNSKTSLNEGRATDNQKIRALIPFLQVYDIKLISHRDLETL